MNHTASEVVRMSRMILFNQAERERENVYFVPWPPANFPSVPPYSFDPKYIVVVSILSALTEVLLQ